MQTAQNAIVIGSGFGGLAAAIRLQARGYQTTLLEQLEQPGGRARVFVQDGLVFDAGPTVITAPFLLEELWQIGGEKLQDHIQLLTVDPFYRIRFAGGELFDYNGDAAAMRAEVAKLAPQDVAGYEAFVKHSQAIYAIGFEQLAHVPFSSLQSMLKIIPSMMKLKSFQSVYQAASGFVKDERLRQILTFHPLLVGGNPFTTSSIYSLILYLERKWGVYFAKGGTTSLVQGLVGLFLRMQGKIRFSSRVVELLTRGRKVTGVRLHTSEVLTANIVVSNGDVAYTYKHLLPEKVRRIWSNRKLNRKQYSMSLFVWYFATRKVYPDVAHHSILLGPRYQGLLDDIFHKHILADDFSLYLHRPAATDHDFAPAGMDVFYVLSPVPNLKSGTNWQLETEKYRQKIAHFLEQTTLPDLQKHLCYSKCITPQTFHDELLSEQGAAFGMSPILRQSAYFRPHNQSEEFSNLFFVGAGTHPGAGLPGVLSSAKVLESLLP